MNREFVRVSLGGVRDEAEIRGHRRTYIGAYPGRIVSALKNAGTINPVVLLDEIDKLSSDYRGDPASALLEVLDPEQNAYFVDHFLDTPYDLSNVLFLTTSNQLSGIPLPLLDRLEVIEIGGYTEDEKIGIARNHLLPKQLEAHGLPEGSLMVSERMWTEIVRGYTREAGVRNLERQIATLCRKAAREIVREVNADENGDEDAKTIRLTPKRLEEFLGPRKYGYDQQFNEAMIGVAIGLGKTSIGGEIIPVRGRDDARFREVDDHRPGRRGHARVCSSCPLLCPVACRATWHCAGFPGEDRPAHSPAGRRNAEGWSIGRHHDSDGVDFGDYTSSGRSQRRDDG